MTHGNTLARRDDPATSRKAAAYASKRLGKLQRATLRALLGRAGWTASELEEADRKRARTYGRRMHDLVDAGLVTIEKERACRITGRHAMTYALTPEGAREVGE